MELSVKNTIMKKKSKKRNQFEEVWRRLKRNKQAMLGLMILVIMIVIAIFANLIADYDQLAIKQNMRIRLQPPNNIHLFGTDSYGRDILARIAHGSRISLTIGLIAVGLSLLGGGIIGSLAGYYKGRLDDILMRIMDMLLAIPAILLAIAIVAALGPGIVNLMIALSIAQTPAYARVIRASIMSIRDREFVEAARAIGASDFQIIFRHIIPNAIGPVIVQATLGVAEAIMAAAGLSFIGLGIEPPAPEWGTMLAEGKEFIRYSPYLVAFPGIAIVITVLSLNLLGDGLRDALDPRLK